MAGYIVLVHRQDEAYRAEVVDLPACAVRAPTVEQALHRAQKALRRWAATGRDLPTPRELQDMLHRGRQGSVVAAACLRHGAMRALGRAS